MTTSTVSFGTTRREGHDVTGFYDRELVDVEFSTDTETGEVPPGVRDKIFEHSSEDTADLPDDSVELMVTSPPESTLPKSLLFAGAELTIAHALRLIHLL